MVSPHQREIYMYHPTSYYNVIQSRRAKKLPIIQPLSGLIPFVAHTLLLVAWLAGPTVDIVHSSMLLPFIGYWGMT